MFSFWLGKLTRKDIRDYGDKNPGAINAFKAAGWKIGIPAMLLDFLKGLIPIFVVYHYMGINDVRIIPIAIAPVLGHAFSPFLNFKGGKAIATSFGIWTGLTLWQGPTVLGLGFVFFKFVIKIKNDDWITILGFILLLIYLLIFNRSFSLMIIFLINLSLIVYKHWPDLR
jgi:glycerol-3-phosphate acyltransferase PlsY